MFRVDDRRTVAVVEELPTHDALPVSWDDDEVGSVPAGTVTLLLADIEGSTRLWERRSSDMPDELERLNRIVDELVAEHDGARPIELGEGDSFVAGFALASDAVACAHALQRATADGLLRLRIGVHTGEVQQREPGLYMGSTINRAARIRDAGHGGQVLISQTTVDLVQDHLPPECSLIDLGLCSLRDVGRPIHLWQLSDPRLPTAFPPLRGLETGRNNLPLQLTSFIGRVAAIGELHDMLDEDRAVTLTGAGGCGKTRLALHVAAQRMSRYPGGAWLVDFAPVNDASAVGMLVADAVGAAPGPGQPAIAAITAALGSVPTLLVLDNCEHLVTECAALVEEILRSCSGATIVATSREPLGFAGEVTFRVPSLSTPARTTATGDGGSFTDSDAVALFADRARRARSRFTIDATNAEVIAEICRRLDGIPLAIELAAARLRALSPEQILEGLHDRFRLLTGGARTAVPRHQTLQASVDWSYALLLEAERVLLQRLSVFAGGFTLEAAELVGAGDELEPHHVFDLLMQLVDKSLVVAEDDGATRRFGMLETVRQYAAGRLVDSGRAAEVRRRHFDYFLAFAAQRLETVDAFRRRIDSDYDNLRRALQWADGHDDPESLVRLAARLYGYWALGLRVGEGHLWLRRAVDAATTPELRGRVLSHFAHVHGMAVSWAEAVPLAEEGVELARASGRPRAVAWTLGQLGNALSNTWRTDEARAAMQEAALTAEASGDEHGRAFALFQLGRALSVVDPAEALEVLQEAVGIARSVGAEYIEHMSTACISWSTAELRDLREAKRLCDDAIAGLRALGDGWFFSSVLSFSAYLSAAAGDDEAADDALRELAALAAQIGPAVRSPAALGPGAVAVMRGRWAEALSHFEHLEGIDVDVARPLLAVALARADAPAVAAEAAIRSDAVGAAPSADRGVALLRAEGAMASGDPRRAAEAARDFLLSEAPGVMTPVFEVHTLQLLAAARAEMDEHEEAARLAGAASAEAERIGMSTSVPFTQLFETHMGRARDALGAEKFHELWDAGAATGWPEVLAYLARGRGSRRRPRSGWAALTPTERQVVDLVTVGLSNKAIAEKLLMSVPTVKSHLTHAFAKVGVSTRTELMAAAQDALQSERD